MAEVSVREAGQKLFEILHKEPEGAETPEQETQEAQVDETPAETEVPEEAGQEDTAKLDDGQDELAAKEEAESDDDAGAEPVSTLAELAEAIGVEQEFLYNDIRIPFKDGPEAREFTIGEVKDLVQDSNRVKKELEAVQSQKSALEAERTESQQKFAERLNELGSLVEAVEAQFNTDEKQLEALRAEDPTEYAIQARELDRRRSAIQEVRQRAIQAYQDAVKENQEKITQDKHSRLQQEAAKLQEAIPEWRDPKVAEAEKQKLVGFLQNFGFSNQDIESVDDHRLFVIARLAMLGDGVSKADPSKKRLKKLPKLVKPGSKKPAPDPEAQKEKRLRDQLKQSGKPQDAAALILGRIK